MDSKINKMKELLMEILPSDQYLQTAVDGVALARRDHSYDPKPMI